MQKNANFANRDVADLILYDYSAKKPYLNVDWANVTSTSFEAERVFATGGKGAPRRVQFDGERTGTLTVEAQVYPVKVFAMLSGNEMGTSATVVKREKLVGASDQSITLTETPASEETIQIYDADDDCGTPIEETEISDTKVTATGKITEGKEYIAYYFVNIPDAQVVHFDSSHFPKSYRIEGSIPFKCEDDTIVESRHIWYKASPQGAFELSWQNTGDPATITMTFDVMADEDGNVYDQIFPNA